MNKRNFTGGTIIALGLTAFIASLTSDPSTSLAKLSPAPGKDGAPPSPQTQAEVDALNDALDVDPDENQSWHA